MTDWIMKNKGTSNANEKIKNIGKFNLTNLCIFLKYFFFFRSCDYKELRIRYLKCQKNLSCGNEKLVFHWKKDWTAKNEREVKWEEKAGWKVIEKVNQEWREKYKYKLFEG